jgi:hypothetical protein
MPQPAYKLSDIQAQPIQGQIYNYELVNVTVSPETEFQIDKIVRTRNNGGINQQFVQWKGYDEEFNSWIDASDMKRI